MGSLFFEQLQQLAQKESRRLNHFYIGVEHLFFALLNLENSLTAAILKQHRIAPEWVRYVLEESLGQTLDRRYWEGFRLTPRCQKVLTIAQSYSQNPAPAERELLLAILDEGQSIPVRVLQALQVDLHSLSESAANWTGDLPPQPVDYIAIESSLPLLTVEKDLLQRLFAGCASLMVDAEFAIGQHSARLYSLTIQNADETRAPALAKFDEPHLILREKRHFDTFVSQTLPANAPTIPTIPQFAIEDRGRLGGLCYSLPNAQPPLRDLAQYAAQFQTDALAELIRNGIFDPLRNLWWEQGERYRFGFWREYEMILPPSLVIETEELHSGHVLHPLEAWSRNTSLKLGETVELQDFTIHSLKPVQQRLLLCASVGDEAVNRASKVQVTGINRERLARYSPGQSEHHLRGMITYRRAELLREYVALLQPNFLIGAADFDAPLGMLPNPIDTLPYLLQYEIEGYLSTIHGALNLSSILVDGGSKLWLTDFTQTRRGHVLFDWAMLEISLLTDLFAPTIGNEWASIWDAARTLKALNAGQQIAEFKPIAAVREIAGSLLAVKGNWREYFAPLVFFGLSYLAQPCSPIGARRLAFVAAALATEAFLTHA